MFLVVDLELMILYDADAPLRGAWGDGSAGEKQRGQGRKAEGAEKGSRGEQGRRARGENGDAEQRSGRRAPQETEGKHHKRGGSREEKGSGRRAGQWLPIPSAGRHTGAGAAEERARAEAGRARTTDAEKCE